MLELNPYAPPRFGAQLESRHRDPVTGTSDPESVRQANLWAERRLLLIAGVGYAFGMAIVLWAVAVAVDDGLRALVPAMMLIAIGATSIASAYWITCRRAVGRWVATALSALCAFMLAPAVMVAVQFEHRYWPLGLTVLVPISLLVGLWWPGGGNVLNELYRRTVVPRTSHLAPRAAMPTGALLGFTVVAYLIVFGLRM